MRFGITCFFTDRSVRPDELAREAEARGFHAMYLPEHTHIPSARKTPAPMGEPLPDYYSRLLDPFVALTAAAAATERIRLGTAILLPAQRDPFTTAKEIATLDHLSGGRFVLGVGFGWNVEEIEHHGTPYAQRRDVARERMLAMQALWREEEASFEGEHVRFDRSWAWPKPVQRPRPLTFIGGGAGPVLFRHIAEYADGWMPIGGRGVAGAVPELRRAVEEAGRDPSALEIVPVGTIPEEGKLAYFQEHGVTEVVLGVETGPRDEILPTLDRYAAIVAPFSG